MKSILLTLSNLLLLHFIGNTQIIPEFSPLSGNVTFFSEITEHQNEFYLLNSFNDPDFKLKIYKISQNAEVLDSINIRESDDAFFSLLKSIDGKLYLGGIKSEPNSQRYIIAQIDEDLSIIEKYESPLFDTLISPSVNGATSEGAFNRLFDFSVVEDTCYIMGSYVLFDTLNNFIGTQPRYYKAELGGDSLTTIIDRPFDCVPYNIFLFDNQMIIQGSNGEGPPFMPPSIGLYDGNGNFVDGWDFDMSGSGIFPFGSCGGKIDNRLYFSYEGEDTALEGCPEVTVALDVRDLNFNPIHRFKIEECDYAYSGNMPFCKGADGSIYFQAVSRIGTKFIVKKFTPDMSLIWSKEYDFTSTNTLQLLPMKMVPSEDGGVILQAIEDYSFVRLFKISEDGDITSSTTIGNHNESSTPVFSPNPFTNELYFNGDSGATLEALIYSMDGKISKRMILDDGNLDVSELPIGYYSIIAYDLNEKNKILYREIVLKIK
jgi:hypothetical protein